MPYIGQGLTEGRRRAYNFVATSNQTTFTATYDVGYVDVYQNGILLTTSDYTATNGTTVVLGVGASASDEITIIAHQLFSVSDTVSAGQGGAFGGAIDVTGNITTTGSLRGPSSFTIDPATHGDNTGTVVIAGDLTVNGTTTTINSTTLTVDDKNLILASGTSNSSTADGSGLTIDLGSDGTATMTYAHATTSIGFNKNITTSGTLNTHTIPGGTGTLALTSQLSAYAPLSGATFSGAITANLATSTDANTSTTGSQINSRTLHLRTRGNSAGISGQTYSNQIISSNGTNVALEMYTIGATGTPVVFGTNSTERMRIDTSGNVGIGTTNPSALQQNYIDSGSANLGLRLTQNNSGQGIWMEFQPGNNTDDWQVGANNAGFAIYNITDSRYDMVIKNDGNVGIGTDNPGSKLDVNGAIHISTDTAGKNTFRLTSNAANDANLIMKSDTTDKVQIQANGVSYFNGGDVGIGATNPGGSRLYLQDTHTTTVTDATTMLSNTTLTINGNSSQGSDVIRMGPMGTAGKQFIDVSNSAGSAAYDLLLNPIGSGNVGIGTTSAGAKLTITDENAGQASLQIRNFNTSATGGFTNSYNVEIRSATSTTTHGMLIHLNENNIGRRALDISDSVGAQSSTIFASFVQGKVGINNTSPQGQLDIVVPQDKIPFIVRSGGKSNVGANSANFFHCYNSLGSSGTWYDVCYVSHSPNIFILGTTLQDGNPALGGSRWCSRMYGTYGSVAHTTFGGGTRTVAMNGGAITGFDYRYLNGGASSGSYRLQVLVNWSGSISTMEVYTTIMGNGTDTLQEDN